MSKNKAADFDDDLPPELEDIPEDILPKKGNKTTAGSGNINLGDYAQPLPETSPVTEEKEEEKKKEEPKKKETFGGLKGGFFNSKPKPKETTAPQPKKQEQQSNIVEIKANPKNDSKVFSEVQEAMKVNQTLLDKQQEWMSPDLLNKFATNPKLTKLFTNPEYMQAIQMMQKNPKEAMARYGGNPEFQELLLEFSSIMGTHFEKMSKEAAKKEQTSQPPRDKKAEEILMDPKVQYLIQYLQKNPKVDFNMIIKQDPELAKKVKYLIDNGYFQVNMG